MITDLKLYPLVIFDAYMSVNTRSTHATRSLIEALEAKDLKVVLAESEEDCFDIIRYSNNLSGIILDWDSFSGDIQHIDAYVDRIKQVNEKLPMYLMTQTHGLEDSSVDMLTHDIHLFWKYADTYDFMAGRIKSDAIDYLVSLLPPFFKALLTYTEENKYVWSTPGHMGGVAFLKSPVGQIFYNYYGEHVFRSDLSISVPELGSLMDHSGVNGEAERFAAKIFGADHTYFVTNGTSTSNKMVVMSCVGDGDVAIVDRNCHKSLQHAMTMGHVIPIYFKPTRNAYGIIGAIPVSEFSLESIEAKIQASPLIKDKTLRPRLAIVTNSTYDGLIYQVDTLKDRLGQCEIPYLLFDEAWYPYAHFHPIYDGKYAMSPYQMDHHPTIFSTQSTHKLLAAFSQASMIHVKNGLVPLNVDLFNETVMMHSSTSPQYSIVASLDISSKMMEGQFGYRLISDSLSEAIAFRQEFQKIQHHFFMSQEWFFKIWQPDAVLQIHKIPACDFTELPASDAAFWMLESKANWHGFSHVDEQFVMLDPIKVTVTTPGIQLDASFDKTGIPAPIVSKFLMLKGTVDEKTSFYSMLFLFSIGVNKSKAMNLLSDLVLFKSFYDQQRGLDEVFPDLLQAYPRRYHGLTLQSLCQEMHEFLKHHDAAQLLMQAFDILPEQVLTPSAAYQHIVRAQCTSYSLDELLNKVVLTMVAPYPPGIPIVMPGERITPASQRIIDYLKLLEQFDQTFPGFENDVHGVEVKIIKGRRKYFVNCMPS